MQMPNYQMLMRKYNRCSADRNICVIKKCVSTQKKQKICLQELLLHCNDKVDSSNDNENSMEGIILSNNFMMANEEEIKEINFISDATNKCENYELLS